MISCCAKVVSQKEGEEGEEDEGEENRKMGRRKKGDSVEQITQQISKIVISTNTHSLLRVVSAQSHRNFYEKTIGSFAPTDEEIAAKEREAAAAEVEGTEGVEGGSVTPPLARLPDRKRFLFSGPTSECIIAGCPSATTVLNGFEAGSVHSDLGKLLKTFVIAVVDLFVKGPETVFDFGDRWADIMNHSCPSKYHYELQGFSPLFSFLYFQLVNAEMKYEEAKRQTTLPTTVKGIDDLITILTELKAMMVAQEKPSEAMQTEVAKDDSKALRDDKSSNNPRRDDLSREEIEMCEALQGAAAGLKPEAKQPFYNRLYPSKPQPPVAPGDSSKAPRRPKENRHHSPANGADHRVDPQSEAPHAAPIVTMELHTGLPLPPVRSTQQMRRHYFLANIGEEIGGSSSQRPPKDDEAEFDPRYPVLSIRARKKSLDIQKLNGPVVVQEVSSARGDGKGDKQTWQEFWAMKEKKKLQDQLGVDAIVEYKSRDLNQFAVELQKMREEVLSRERGGHGDGGDEPLLITAEGSSSSIQYSTTAQRRNKAPQQQAKPNPKSLLHSDSAFFPGADPIPELKPSNDATPFVQSPEV